MTVLPYHNYIHTISREKDLYSHIIYFHVKSLDTDDKDTHFTWRITHTERAQWQGQSGDKHYLSTFLSMSQTTFHTPYYTFTICKFSCCVSGKRAFYSNCFAHKDITKWKGKCEWTQNKRCSNCTGTIHWNTANILNTGNFLYNTGEKRLGST